MIKIFSIVKIDHIRYYESDKQSLQNGKAPGGFTESLPCFDVVNYCMVSGHDY